MDNDISIKTTWRDAVAYLLAYILWIAFSALSAVLLVLVKSAAIPLVAVLLLRNPYYRLHTVELRGMINTVDRTTLIVLAILWVIYIFWLEEQFRGSIREAREQRMRALLLNEGQPVAETGLQRWNLHLLLRRGRSAVIVPAATLVIYLVLQILSWRIIH